MLPSGLSISTADILLVSRLAHGRFERRLGRLALTRQSLQPPLILAAGVDHHGPIGLPL